MKVISFSLSTLSILCFCVITTAAAGENAKGRLGYGFMPGLAAGKDFVAGQLIVGFREGVGIANIETAASTSGGKTAKRIRGAILIEFPSEDATLNAVNALIALPEVAFVERNGFMSIPPKPALPDLKGDKTRSSDLTAQDLNAQDLNAMTVSSDPATGYQWQHTVTRKTASLPVLSTTPPTVAVIDTGVDYTHPDLSGKVILGKNCVEGNMMPFDDNGHGTHVAGIIGANAGNGAYGEGVCPLCKILAVKVLGADGSGTFFDVACGTQYSRTASTTPATKVINMSLGGGFSALMASEVDAIKAAGKVLVAAAGNSNSSTVFFYPGADPDTALRVMATEENDCRAWFSNFSPAANPTLYNMAAPGWNIPSTLPGGEYGPMSGTSMASPVVAGAAALVWGQIPSLTRDGLVSRLRTYGKAINCGFAASTRRVNVRNAIYGNYETAIIGRILDPATGRAPSPPTTPTLASLYSGAMLLKSDGTNRGGFYEMTGLSAGSSRTLRGSRTGYMTSDVKTGIAISSGIVAGPFTDALPRTRAAGFATVTIDWRRTQPTIAAIGCTGACNGWELDLWVKLPDGSYVYWDASGDLMAWPFVRHFRDSYDDLVPMESIVVGSSADNGVYNVFAENWETNPSWTGSWAHMQVFTGTTIRSSALVPSTCGANGFWHLGNITKSGTSYTWTPVNTCSSTSP